MGLIEMYKEWNLQVFMSLSLFAQVFLLIFSPLRKRVSYIKPVIWFAYLQAANVAYYGLSLITTTDESCKDENHRLILWAPFLLAHLGGFDTITAYALQDNELWTRNLLLLPIKLGLCIFAFAKLGTRYNTGLWVSVILVFLVGLIKCFERIRSLYLASPPQRQESLIRPDDHHRRWFRLKPLMEFKLRVPKWKSVKEEGIINVDQLHQLQILQIAYVFFHSFQRLIANLSISLEDRKRSQNLFFQLQPKAAYKIVETELNLLYDTLHTKLVALRGYFGFISRLFSFVLLGLALIVFIGVEKKHILSPIDIKITYSLFAGAIFLDIIFFIMFVYSDWGAITLMAISKEDNNDQSCSNKILKLLHPSWFSCMANTGKRWSESIPQFNLIENARRGIRLKVIRKRFDMKIGENIFHVLHKIASMPTDLKPIEEVCLARGSWLLKNETKDLFLEYIQDIEYEESITLWHIATNICYFTEGEGEGEGNSRKQNFNLRESTMVISNYIHFLLIKYPTMISATSGTGQLIYEDTYTSLVQMKESRWRRRFKCKKSKEFCEDILNEVWMKKVAKGDKNKSKRERLTKAKELAEKLRGLNAKEMWEVVNEVWVGIMIYAASQCNATDHAKQLAVGGQLITIVWLLMAHLGLGMCFMESEKVTLPKSIGRIDLTKGNKQSNQLTPPV